MLPKQRQRKRKGKGRAQSSGLIRASSEIVCPPNALVYRGPCRIPAAVTPPSQIVEIHDENGGAATVAGVFTFQIDSAGVRTLGNDFSSWSNLYSEYRVLSIRQEYYPNTPGGTTIVAAGVTPVIYAPVYTVVTRDDATVPASYVSLLDNTSLRVFSLTMPWFREARMSTVDEAGFYAVSVSPAVKDSYQAKSFATGLTALYPYGRLIDRWIVQFRTRN